MPDPAPEVPNRNLGNTELDMSQPDGIPREAEKPVQPKGPDGKFVKKDEAHPTYLLNLASRLGFSESQCAIMSTEALGVAVEHAQARESEWQQRLQSTQPQAQVKPPEPEPSFDLGVDLKEYDENLGKAFTSLQKEAIESRKALKELRDELAQTKARDQDRSIAQSKTLIDDAFEALGPEYAAYFGTGTGDDLKASDNASFRRRILALQETGLDARVTSGKQLLSKLKAKADEIFKIEKKEAPAADARPEKKKGRFTREEWEAGGTAVPTQRESDQEPFGRDRAIKNAERRARESGHSVSPSTVKEDQELRNSFKRN